jgi:hypothetical protein
MSESRHVKEVKSEKKAETEKPKGKASSKAKRVLGIRLVETRFGKRILIEQGSNRVWLREADVVQLLSVLAREAFGGKEEEKPEAQ